MQAVLERLITDGRSAPGTLQRERRRGHPPSAVNSSGGHDGHESEADMTDQ
jgi:hypothetical protein